MLPRKIIPPATIDNILPPNRGFHYFEGAKELPFQFSSDNFEIANAWWLAEASLLAYADETSVREQYRQVGIMNVKAFKGISTQCYAAWNDKFAIISFRGTCVLKPGEKPKLQAVLRDLVTDARFCLADSGQTGSVHEGFKEGLEQIWDGPRDNQKLGSHLDWLRQNKKNRTMWFTGHSLGAALATLATSQYGQVDGLYTFGSPRVGDENFVEALSRANSRIYRFVNNNDIITHIPRAALYRNTNSIGLYRHVGSLRHIDATGNIRTHQGLGERLTDRLQGYWLRLKHMLGDFTHDLPEIPDDNFVDHAPLYYAIHLWNFA